MKSLLTATLLASVLATPALADTARKYERVVFADGDTIIKANITKNKAKRITVPKNYKIKTDKAKLAERHNKLHPSKKREFG